MVIGTDCRGSCKSNYHIKSNYYMITTTTAPDSIGILCRTWNDMTNILQDLFMIHVVFKSWFLFFIWFFNFLFSAKNGSSYPKYPCQDPHRADNFDKYYDCQCQPGYTGLHCESDIDECLSSPCTEPHVCYNHINGYACDCPVDNPKCDFKPWVVAVGVVSGLLFIFIILAGLWRYKVKRR
jgi:hypothetical protein